jgi:hypothetical protein
MKYHATHDSLDATEFYSATEASVGAQQQRLSAYLMAYQVTSSP